LRDHFEFVFVDAPFESDPGPGILPTFEGCGPYFRWTALEEGENEGRAMGEVLRRLGEEPGTERIVGLLGFSQGVRVVVGMLLWQQTARYLPTSWPIRLRFAVCAMGDASQPLHLIEARDEIIRIPTIHVHGIRDPIYLQSKLLVPRHFDPKSTRVLTVNAGHHLPKEMKETNRLAEMMLDAYYPGGHGAVGLEIDSRTVTSY
jgi:hypothetical protein